ncbi:MAG TPA: fluoride efflux transporter CrcB [Allosphingosinicella sp.]
MSYFLVFIGAGIGGALRHGVNRLSLASFGPGFPWGTLFVNVAGGLVVGAIAGLMAEKVTGSQELRLFLTTGLLGGFTTFSAFSLEVALMWQRGEHGAALAYSLASVVISVGAVFAGLALAAR